MIPRTYRFGEFELHEPLFELRRGGTRVELQPKALDLLLCLVRSPDRVVLKKELLAQLWPDVVVSEASLSKAVSAVRRAIGDSGGAQFYIETVRGRGFRFVAAVETCESPLSIAAARHASSPGAHEAEGDFVGREDVLRTIGDAFSSASQGAGRMLLLSGEAGMGKTRTAREAAARCQQAGGHALLGWCTQGEGVPALWPWLLLLRRLAAVHEPLLKELGDEGTELAVLLSPQHPSSPDLSLPSPVEPAQARFRLFDTVARFLELVSRRGTHLLILDDFHWADRASFSLLDFLSHTVSSSRLVLVVTCREEDLQDAALLREVGRRPGCEAKALVGLSREHVTRLVESEVGRSVPAAVVAMIHQRTEGNPFFVKELTGALAAQGALDASSSVSSASPLPAGITAVLRQRLDRLSPACTEVLAIAAAMGRDVDLGVLAAVSGRAADRLLERLDEARAARLLRFTGGGYSFAHALVREALLQQISVAERARLHRRIGETLAARHRDDLGPHLPALAYHFCAGAASGCAEQAIAYARRAGERAFGIFAADEAAAHYRSALAAQALATAPDERVRCEILVALGEAQMSSGQTEAGQLTLRQAVNLAHHLGAGELLARAALASGGLEFSSEVGVYDPDLIEWLEEGLAALPPGDSPLRVRLQVRLAIALCWAPALERVRELIEGAVAAARRLGDPAAVAHALYVHRWILNGPGDLEGRLGDSDEMLRLARQARRRDLELAARSCRFLDLTELGRLAEADRELATYDRLAEQLRVPRYRWRACFYHAMRALLEGRFTQAEELALQALADGQRFQVNEAVVVFGTQLLMLRLEQGHVAELEATLRSFIARFPAVPAWRVGLPLLHVEMGRLPDARESFEALAVDDFQALPGDVNWLPAMAFLAEACSLLEDAERAGKLYALLRPFAPRTVMIGIGVVCWGALDRFLGSLAITAGNWDAAVRHLEAALRMNTRIGARPWVGWTHYESARMLVRRGRAGAREQAQVHLTRARETAAALGMARLARRVDALAAEIE